MGKNADMVIFDYDTIMDRADYVTRGNPDEAPDGISWVIVNGHVVVRDGTLLPENKHGLYIKV